MTKLERLLLYGLILTTFALGIACWTSSNAMKAVTNNVDTIYHNGWNRPNKTPAKHLVLKVFNANGDPIGKATSTADEVQLGVAHLLIIVTEEPEPRK